MLLCEGLWIAFQINLPWVEFGGFAILEYSRRHVGFFATKNWWDAETALVAAEICQSLEKPTWKYTPLYGLLGSQWTMIY